MYRKTIWIVLLAAASASVLAAGRTATKLTPSTTTYLGYNPSTGTNNLTQHILYLLPNASLFGPGPYPVFIWTAGSGEPYNDPQSQILMQLMAAQGFLAASVQYSSTEVVQVCSSYTERAQSVFNATASTSAVSVLCNIKGAACSKGIVTAGISQGGMLAVLAKNYAPEVEATFAMSVSDYNLDGGVNLASCMDKQYTAIPANRLTIVNGIADQYFGGQQPLENVSGYTCPTGTYQCWSPTSSGAGWYIVQNSQVEDGVADHCYQMVGGCFSLGGFDPNWYLPSTYDWSLMPNLDWLATFGTKRVFSSTGY